MSKTFIPSSVALELTYKCNHRCKFCSCPWFAPSNRYPMQHELSIDEWKKAVDILFKNGVKYYSITGGEALLKDGFENLLSYIRQKSTEAHLDNPIILISNGLNMCMEYLKLFKELNVHLSMSFPGYDTFEYHTGINNANNILRLFSKAQSIGLKTTINVTVTRKNIDELFETVSLGLISGADSVLLNRFLPGGRGLDYYDDLKLDKSHINKMLDVVEEVLEYSNRYGSVGTEIPFCIIDNPQKYKHLHIGYQCAAAKEFFVIDPSGQIRTCNHSPKIVGNIFKTPLIIDLAYWNIFLLSKYKPVTCSHCDTISKCDCGCREVANILTGKSNAVDVSIM